MPATPTPDSRTRGPWGDPSHHLPATEIEAGLARLGPPRDRGQVTLLVSRREDGTRETPQMVRLTRAGGMPGDAWLRKTPDRTDAQLAVMRTDVGRLIANGQELTLFGDNLVVDLDLSRANLPEGTRVRIGEATLEVTPKPHNGCQKYRQRFGADALRVISASERRDARLRGIYLCVVEDGDVGVGDAIEVVERGSCAASDGE